MTRNAPEGQPFPPSHTDPTPPLASADNDRSASRVLPAVLLLLNVFGPISMDLYLPVLPKPTTDLRTTTSTAQLTVTACLLGLALGRDG